VNGKSVTFASWFYTTSDTAYIAQTIISGVVGDVCAGDPVCRADAVLECGPNAGGAVIGLTVTNGLKGIRSGSVVDITHCHVIGTADGTNYTNGGGGTFSDNLFANNSDDGIDINGKVNVRVVNNIIRDNDDDGLEFRMYAYSGPLLTTEITGNIITGNREDGIQFIDYPDSSSRSLRVERNLFRNNAKVGVSVIGSGPTDTSEDYSGPPMPEHLFVFNNTFIGDHYGIVGGANVVALNNIFADVQVRALRRVAVNSIASHNLFWNNAGNFEESNVDLTTSLLVDPLLAADYTLLAGSPAIDAGTALFQWQGQTVLDMPPASYLGSAPDMGVFESSFAGPPPGNQAPGVDAGPNQTITLPSDANLDGSVNDDGLPNPPGAVTTGWSVSSGPGPVTFLNPAAVDTRVTFTTAGSYLLRLTANDGERVASDSVQITVQALVGTIERRIAAGGDDGEEAAAGKVYLSSSDLEMVFDTDIQKIGLRFTNLTIPAGATVTRAYLQFQADETQSEATNLLIQGEAADNALVLGSVAGNISSRSRTSASVSWSPLAWTLVGEAGDRQRPPDLAAVVQEIVRRPGWASGNALVLIITGTGHRTAEAFEGDASGAPLLHIEYSVGPPPSNMAPTVDAGPNQTITLPADAVLDGTVSDDNLPDPPRLVTTTWSVGSGSGPVSFLNPGAVDTRATFTTAGTYVLRLTANDGALAAMDSVQITVQPAPPPGAGTVERRIATGVDDAEEAATGKVSLTSTDTELVFDKDNQKVGLRFTNMTIPNGATITRAYLQFRADEKQSEATNLIIQGQAADNAAAFTTTTTNVSSRPRTAASISWSPPAWNLVGETGAGQRTPDLSPVIQQIVNRSGWGSGNALVLIITGTGHRTAEAFEGSAADAALLHIEYSVGGASPSSMEAASSDDIPKTEFALHRVSPLPARDVLRVEFTLSHDGPARLELMDVAGRRVAEHEVASLGPGRHVIEIRDRLEAGVYFVRLSQGGRARFAKAVVAR